MSFPASSASLLDYPISPPPPGQTPNFANPESRASWIYIASGICVPLILIFAALRIYAKVVVLNKRKSWDDLYRLVVVRNTDNTWETIPVWTTSIVEMTAGMTVCCMPTTAAVFLNIKFSPSSIFSSILSRGRRALKSSMKSSTRHEELGSASELRHVDSGRLVPAATSNEWRMEDWSDAHSDRIPKSGIRETKQVNVAFGTSRK
ncbi:hypothetical protein NHQ30_001904 [Ciborinia camelliae]|nr:hypothetical protein NHQ30_001904 [Ciborinia camelliae]